MTPHFIGLTRARSIALGQLILLVALALLWQVDTGDTSPGAIHWGYLAVVLGTPISLGLAMIARWSLLTEPDRSPVPLALQTITGLAFALSLLLVPIAVLGETVFNLD